MTFLKLANSTQSKLIGKILRTSMLLDTIILFSVFTLFFSYSHYQLKNQYHDKLISLASTAAQLIDPKEHNALGTREDEQSQAYKEIKLLLGEFKKVNSDIIKIYTIKKAAEEIQWEFVVDAEEEEPSHIGDLYDLSQLEELKKAYNGPIIKKAYVQSQLGSMLLGYAPIRDENGNAIALVGIEMDLRTIHAENVHISLGALILFFLALGLVLFITHKVSNYFLAPLQDIVFGIQELQRGNLSYKIKIQTKDEFEDLGKLLNMTSNMMVEHQKTIIQNLQKEKKQKFRLLKVYSDVISSVTQGKFNLITPYRAKIFSSKGELLDKISLQNPQDVNRARELVSQVLEDQHYRVNNVMHLQLCVSEAATNVLKHAGSGGLEIRKMDDFLRIVIWDKGQGMDYDKLPHMIFLQGFSTKISMGVGISLIYKFAHKIYLTTSENGTSLLMDFQLH